MAGMGDLLGGIGLGNFSGNGFVGSIVLIILATVALAVCGFVVWWLIKRKKGWNLKVEFKFPRNIREIENEEGVLTVHGTLNKEWGKGFYDDKKGVVMLKRKGKKAVPMKPFDVKRHLSSGNILTIIQVGVEDYRPVLDESYIEVVDENGEEAALIKAKIDTTEGKSWKNSYERERKNTYTIVNWLRENAQMISLGIVVMMILVGFGVLWTRLPQICG